MTGGQDGHAPMMATLFSSFRSSGLPLSHSLSGQSSPMANKDGGNRSEVLVISMRVMGMMF